MRISLANFNKINNDPNLLSNEKKNNRKMKRKKKMKIYLVREKMQMINFWAKKMFFKENIFSKYKFCKQKSSLFFSETLMKFLKNKKWKNSKKLRKFKII